MKVTEHITVPNTTGLILHRAFGYDLLVWLLSLGRERTYREKTLELAGLKAGESVLDVGCGTGNLAILAKRHVGATGAVFGIDAWPEMIARARRKASKVAIEVTFDNALMTMIREARPKSISGPRHARLPPRALVVIVIGFVTAHVILFYCTRHVAVSSALVSGLLLLLIAKHWGLLAAPLRPVRALLRRRSLSWRS